MVSVMVRKRVPEWMIFLSCIAAAFCDPYEYSECVRPLSAEKLKNDVFYQFKVFGLVYDQFNFNDYYGRIFMAVNVASF